MTQIPHDYRPAPDLLKDRVILITGAGDGIGAAVARACAAHGATVVLLGRTIRKLEAVYDAIEQAGHPTPAIYPMNLEGAVAKDYADLGLKLDEEFGRLDGLLHNAANLGTLSPLEHYDPEMWDKVLQVNLTAPYLLSRACLKLLKQSKDATVVFTGADVGRRGRAYWGAYAAAHAGAENLMEVMADEVEALGTVRVNSIDPGAVRTAQRTRAFPAEDPNQLPMPTDIVGPYLYLLGGDSHGIHGQRLAAQPVASSTAESATPS